MPSDDLLAGMNDRHRAVLSLFSGGDTPTVYDIYECYYGRDPIAYGHRTRRRQQQAIWYTLSRLNARLAYFGRVIRPWKTKGTYALVSKA